MTQVIESSLDLVTQAQHFLCLGINWERFQVIHKSFENVLAVYYLREAEYEKIVKSELLPDLDLSLLNRCLLISSPLEAVKEFRRHLITE